jgi:hypothetical protein
VTAIIHGNDVKPNNMYYIDCKPGLIKHFNVLTETTLALISQIESNKDKNSRIIEVEDASKKMIDSSASKS